MGSLKLENINIIKPVKKQDVNNILTYTEDYHPLMEGIFHTYPIEDVQKFFMRYYGLPKEQIQIINGENKEKELNIYIPPSQDAYDKIEKSLKLCGYYISQLEKRVQYWVICGEKSKTNDINDKISNIKRIYHITPSYNYDKIKEIGLCPKTKNKGLNYPERIYFGLDINSIKLLKNQLKKNEKLYNVKSNKADKTMLNDYVLLEIDKQKLGDNIKFYYDVNAENCIYTTDNIPLQFIKLLMYF